MSHKFLLLRLNSPLPQVPGVTKVGPTELTNFFFPFLDGTSTEPTPQQVVQNFVTEQVQQQFVASVSNATDAPEGIVAGTSGCQFFRLCVYQIVRLDRQIGFNGD